MDLARRVYTRDLKIAAMREIDNGRTIGEVARQLELSPNLLQRWRSEWQARGELAFPGVGRRGVTPVLDELQRRAELERKIGQLTMENDFLKKPRPENLWVRWVTQGSGCMRKRWSFRHVASNERCSSSEPLYNSGPPSWSISLLSSRPAGNLLREGS
jgi:transposase